jgi:hypothetical protein
LGFKSFALNTNKVFDNIYNNLVENYIQENIIKNAYIDASHIKNVGGNDCIGKNHYDRFRNSTKLHLLIDQNRMTRAELHITI